MLKMLLDPMGGIVMTNDGNAILREIDCKHPAAKSMIELARAQDEEVGDGTTSVICLAGELMQAASPFIENEIHPTVIVRAYYKALDDALKVIDNIAVPIDVNSDEQVKKALTSCVGTKFAARWGSLVVDLALTACRTIMRGVKGNTKLNLEIKRYARIEKIPGGMLDECKVLNGVMLNKDITHPQMRREIRNPRVLLLDCPLEYKKGESQTNMEMTKDTDMVDALQQEINEVAQVCAYILKHNPDVVITEKGVSDLAQHFLLKGNCSVIRRYYPLTLESERLTTTESPELLEPPSSTDQKRSKRAISEMTAACSRSRRSATSTSPTSLKPRTHLPAPFCSEVALRIPLMKWRETSMMLSVLPETSLLAQRWFLEEEPLKWPSATS